MSERNGSALPTELSLLRNQYADQRDRDAVDAAFYAASSGDPNTAPVQLSVLVAANAQLLKAYPDQLKKALAALPTPEQVTELGKGMRDVRNACNELKSATGLDSPLVKWAKRAGIAVAALVIGFFMGEMNGVTRENTDLDRIIDAQPSANKVPLWLAGHGGYMYMGHITSADGVHQGIIIDPGSLKFGQPSFSSDGADILLPLR